VGGERDFSLHIPLGEGKKVLLISGGEEELVLFTLAGKKEKKGCN